MKHEKLSEALNEISDSHIAEAAKPKTKLRLSWVGAVAAVAAIAILATALLPRFSSPGAAPGLPGGASPSRFLVAAPVYPDMVTYSEDSRSEWRESQNAQYDQPLDYAAGTEDFFKASMQQLLSGSTENTACSPVNIYMALAMLTEAAGGNSRQQLLDLLGSDSAEALRVQAGHVWNAHYCDDGLSASLLANSLWLDEAFQYDQATADLLADSYYASVYRGDLGSADINKAFRAWLDEQTHGLLQEQAKDIALNPACVMALASTIYYNVEWAEEFYEGNNYEGIFHAPGGDTDTTFMFRTLSGLPCYEGENFRAVFLNLKDGSRMWLILPEDGTTPSDLLAEGTALDMVLGKAGEYAEAQYGLIKLSLPKFDIAAHTDLIPELQALGITDIFDPDIADLTTLIPRGDDNNYVSQARHAARVTVDEKGITATAFTTILADNAAALPPENEIEFTLDRPFLFIIESRDGLPLFSGVVNEP